MLTRKQRPLFFYSPEPGTGGDPAKVDPPTPNPTPTGGGTNNEEKKFSQEDVNRFNAESNRKAAEKAKAELLEAFGVKTPDEIKTALETLKKIEDEKKSELEKAQAEVAKHKADADKAKADAELALSNANERLMQAAVLLEAQKAGVEDSEIKSVWRELRDTPALLEKLKPNDAGEYEGAAEAVKKIVEAHPKWVTATPKPKTPGTPPAKANGSVSAPKPEHDKPRRVGGDL